MLPNFIVWLPSFSSPWLAQLVSKCHLVIFAFGRFLDFFHSVTKVSKPRIFCEIICVSKRILVILIRMLYCTAFFKAKTFLILFFFFSFVWFVSGEGILLGVIFPGDNFLGGKIPGGNLHYNSAHKLVEKFGKSWVYQFF